MFGSHPSGRITTICRLSGCPGTTRYYPSSYPPPVFSKTGNRPLMSPPRPPPTLYGSRKPFFDTLVDKAVSAPSGFFAQAAARAYSATRASYSASMLSIAFIFCHTVRQCVTVCRLRPLFSYPSRIHVRPRGYQCSTDQAVRIGHTSEKSVISFFCFWKYSRRSCMMS